MTSGHLLVTSNRCALTRNKIPRKAPTASSLPLATVGAKKTFEVAALDPGEPATVPRGSSLLEPLRRCNNNFAGGVNPCTRAPPHRDHRPVQEPPSSLAKSCRAATPRYLVLPFHPQFMMPLCGERESPVRPATSARLVRRGPPPRLGTPLLRINGYEFQGGVPI